MGRTKDDLQEFAIEQVNQVLSCITESKTKTWLDLWQVAYQFCCKDYDYAVEHAKEWNVKPVFLIVASLLYVEHPLLVGQGRSWLYSLVGAEVEVIKAQMHRWDLAVPIKSTDSINTHVDRICVSVERINK